MTTEQFAYWLQGFAELNAEPPTAEQWQAIRDQLALVFERKTQCVVNTVNISRQNDEGKTIADCMSKFNNTLNFGTGPEPRIT